MGATRQNQSYSVLSEGSEGEQVLKAMLQAQGSPLCS